MTDILSYLYVSRYLLLSYQVSHLRVGKMEICHDLAYNDIYVFVMHLSYAYIIYMLHLKCTVVLFSFESVFG